MISDHIAEVRIDDIGRLCVFPETRAFPFVWRTGTEVHWDELGRFLHSPAPREWSYVHWFQQIVAAVANEYDCSLIITPLTRWHNADTSLQSAILAAMNISNV